MTALSEAPAGPTLPKAPTSVRGLDEITRGGLPRGQRIAGREERVAADGLAGPGGDGPAVGRSRWQRYNDDPEQR